VLTLIAKDENIGIVNQINLLAVTLNSHKFHSLFTSSLEMDKYAFVKRLREIVEDQEHFDTRYLMPTDKKKLSGITHKENALIRPYWEAIDKGDTGKKFSLVTEQEI